ncbi:DUF5444 family protein [Pantoea sp.]|uniref:DUF5444 family protein n=1 Tax=Pantoea sp. TaxID=69393 RepID=UPI00289C2931|nr:DUF5444 family protein [Pantoea sp.]
MTIIPVNGTILVQQGCRVFNKLYEESFPDTKEGMRAAVLWASEISLTFHVSQDADFENWRKRHAA